ncbi:hypothetical protein BpHYR1_036142 [Brachionus plicatilis]|uniref:Uncharacterized protein n=1 Tax=Brachionus plicatilis TaxID=10195 RepID=A0A3M7S625_BRAPC|nr:hypothetical protein BpHYR1_036142 [Brachionus plicatilis]
MRSIIRSSVYQGYKTVEVQPVSRDAFLTKALSFIIISPDTLKSQQHEFFAFPGSYCGGLIPQLPKIGSYCFSSSQV